MEISQSDIYEELIRLLAIDKLRFEIRGNGYTNPFFNKTLFHDDAAPQYAIFVNINTSIITIIPLHDCDLGSDEYNFSLSDPNCFQNIIKKIKE